jgi:hypothetical protein
VPNKPRSTAEKTRRRETVDTMRRQQQAKERRKTAFFVGGAVLVGIAIVAAAAAPAVIKAMNDPKKKAISSFGVSAADASCDAVTNDSASGGQQHVAAGTTVDYATIPPSSGKHFGTPAAFSRKFYSAADVPPLEQLVHNLEHGYTILWYDKTVKGDQLQALKDLSERVPVAQETGGKFIVAAWDGSRGAFPAGKHVAISHWGSPQASGGEKGHRQLCGQVSGEVVEKFINQFPYVNSPEPSGA